MSVFFGTQMEETSNGQIGIDNRDILQIDRTIPREGMLGWRRDLTLSVTAPGGLYITRSRSDDIYLVLVTRYSRKGFSHERLMAPANQYVRCWRQEKHVVRNGGKMLDVTIVSAKIGDLFCIAGEYGTVYMVCENGIYVKKVFDTEDLAEVAAEYRLRFGNHMTLCLEPEGFNNAMWRDVTPQFVW